MTRKRRSGTSLVRRSDGLLWIGLLDVGLCGMFGNEYVYIYMKEDEST